MTEQAPEIIGREILRTESALERDADKLGKTARSQHRARAETLRWALHVALTGDRTNPPGKEVEDFLASLSASDI